MRLLQFCDDKPILIRPQAVYIDNLTEQAHRFGRVRYLEPLGSQIQFGNNPLIIQIQPLNIPVGFGPRRQHNAFRQSAAAKKKSRLRRQRRKVQIANPFSLKALVNGDDGIQGINGRLIILRAHIGFSFGKQGIQVIVIGIAADCGRRFGHCCDSRRRRGKGRQRHGRRRRRARQ